MELENLARCHQLQVLRRLSLPKSLSGVTGRSGCDTAAPMIESLTKLLLVTRSGTVFPGLTNHDKMMPQSWSVAPHVCTTGP